jgi:hypothetical protein
MMRSPFHSRIRGLLLVGVLAMAAPATAGAATVSETGGKLTYSTTAGESNHVVISGWGFALKVTETGTQHSAPIKLVNGPGCWGLADGSATCSAAALSLKADLRDGNDFFDASYISFAADLTGGSGADTLRGGSGDDTFAVSDSAADTISCGAGTDGGTGDALDSFDADCESALRSDPPATTEARAPTQRVRDVAVSPSGVARVQVVCPAGSGGCTGTVAIELPPSAEGKVVASGLQRRPVRIGQARFAAKPGTAPIVPVQLTKRGRQRIMRGRRSRGRLRIDVRSADGSRVVTCEDVTLTASSQTGRARGRR